MASFDQYIYYSYSGKAEQRQSFGLCTPSSYEELRRWAYSLWYDLRQRQGAEGRKPTAAVWIGETRYHPAQAEIDEYDERVLKVLRDRQLYKRVDSGAADTQDMEDDEEPAEEVEVEDTPTDEPPEDEEVVSITLDDDDDLDF